MSNVTVVKGGTDQADWVRANAERITNRAVDLMVAKHRNYGAAGIAAAPGGPMNGLLVRMHDKQARLNNMLVNGVADAVGEDSVETLTDLLNYCVISIMVIEGTWPGTEAA